MVQCPTCLGKKMLAGFILDGEKSHYVAHACYMCRGTGEIDDAWVVRLEKGRLMRDRRIARGELLYDAAKRLGLTPAELSRVESGGLLDCSRDHLLLKDNNEN